MGSLPGHRVFAVRLVHDSDHRTIDIVSIVEVSSPQHRHADCVKNRGVTPMMPTSRPLMDR
jgi:hypothetical protein